MRAEGLLHLAMLGEDYRLVIFCEQFSRLCRHLAHLLCALPSAVLAGGAEGSGIWADRQGDRQGEHLMAFGAFDVVDLLALGELPLRRSANEKSLTAARARQPINDIDRRHRNWRHLAVVWRVDHRGGSSRVMTITAATAITNTIENPPSKAVTILVLSVGSISQDSAATHARIAAYQAKPRAISNATVIAAAPWRGQRERALSQLASLPRNSACRADPATYFGQQSARMLAASPPARRCGPRRSLCAACTPS